MGRVDGMACFVQRTAPGDVAQVTLRKRSRFATGQLLQLIEESPERVVPRCTHYVVDRCGGCQLQHMHGDAQRTTKARIVRDALQRIARRDVALPMVQAGPQDWEYRRRLTLSLVRRGSRWIGGLHPYDDPVSVFALRECPISHPSLVDAWRAVDAASRFLPETTALRVGLRLLDDESVALVVIGGEEWNQREQFVGAVRSVPSGIRDVWWETGSGTRVQVAPGAGPENHGATNGRDGADDDNAIVAAADARANALAFVQINTAVAAMLREFVVRAVVARESRRVVDAYAGSGLLTEQLARRGLLVTSVEIDPVATSRAEERVRDLDSVRIMTGGVEALMSEAIETTRPDVVIVNPPRRGLEPALPHMLNESLATGSRYIIYISCDPATLSRDLSGLPNWRITDLTCFDMFPQTAHVETVCVLEPESVA